MVCFRLSKSTSTTQCLCDTEDDVVHKRPHHKRKTAESAEKFGIGLNLYIVLC